MGNTNSSSLVQRVLYNPSDYTQQGSLNDIRYGNIKQLKKKDTEQLCAEITKTLNDEKQWQTRVSELKFRLQLDHPNLVKLLNFNSSMNNEFCSSFYKIGLLYEYYTNDLKTEISERKRVSKSYSESELLYLLQSLASAVFYLKSRSVVHGDIRPYNVLVNNENGQVKLGEMYIQQQSMSNYAQLLSGITEDCYISPQLLENLKKHAQSPAFDTNKSEIFSLGATVLEAATLESVSLTCYDREYYNIDWNQVNTLLSRVRYQYSSNFYQLLQKTLIESEPQRISVEELLEQLENPWAKNSKASGLNTIEIRNLIASQNNSTIIQNNVAEPIKYDRVIQESMPSVRYENAKYENFAVQPTYKYDPIITTNTYAVDPIVTTNTYVLESNTNYNNNDLDSRIEAILKMSRDTVQKYGSSNVYTTTTTTTTNNNNYQVPETNIQEQVEQIKQSGKKNVTYEVNNYTPITQTYNSSYQPTGAYAVEDLKRCGQVQSQHISTNSYVMEDAKKYGQVQPQNISTNSYVMEDSKRYGQVQPQNISTNSYVMEDSKRYGQVQPQNISTNSYVMEDSKRYGQVQPQNISTNSYVMEDSKRYGQVQPQNISTNSYVMEDAKRYGQVQSIAQENKFTDTQVMEESKRSGQIQQVEQRINYTTNTYHNDYVPQSNYTVQNNYGGVSRDENIKRSEKNYDSQLENSYSENTYGFNNNVPVNETYEVNNKEGYSNNNGQTMNEAERDSYIQKMLAEARKGSNGENYTTTYNSRVVETGNQMRF
ncbi:hypothetical protein IMG5_185550 [Ichthyophthirius multifiliis]|uniref:Protein kinase domain-containing protein n=1 Tax=Ichthyophthirius multifiliis TaxID=5932 RepID=G0R3I3_ICHMU|nr:hypothetical protein IMG5_185550 [Ichthyophthirius multifiliis]EGR27972.1 hypothetical protein IMG5_185550 [Ichthyophthirius multifiliis]|eukprot:XP_004027317.1 hypothetical protein IMG5_185550 [Ichthyophthirius multifiliis]